MSSYARPAEDSGQSKAVTGMSLKKSDLLIKDVKSHQGR